MQEIEIKVDITVKCGECGTELSAEYDTRRSIFTVTPCEACLKKEYDNGYNAGAESDEGNY
jgi:hypothetical protein